MSTDTPESYEVRFASGRDRSGRSDLLAVYAVLIGMACLAVLACTGQADPAATTARRSIDPSAIRGTRLLPSESDLAIPRLSVSVTGPVAPGEKATVTAQSVAGASCTISVAYASGLSEAQGLDAKTASDEGAVSWTWVIGPNTTPGAWPVEVLCVNVDSRRQRGGGILNVGAREQSD